MTAKLIFMSNKALSVVICARNEASRIERAITSVQACAPDEIIVVDGGSTDETVAISESLGVRVVRSGGRGLPYDRQLGANQARHEYVAYIDADHRPDSMALKMLMDDLDHFGFDVVQAGVGIEDNGFWCRAEHDALVVFHHKPGPRSKMLGLAPTIFRKQVLDEVGFDLTNPLQSDDADLFKRISDTGKYTFGVGRTVIAQEHHGDFSDYMKKFRWYGQRDAEFMIKHSDRAPSMLFHLLVRYPVWRPLKAIFMGKPRAVAYFWLCGGTRLVSCSGRLIKRALGKAAADRPQEAGEAG